MSVSKVLYTIALVLIIAWGIVFIGGIYEGPLVHILIEIALVLVLLTLMAKKQ